mmetsp:Transcript_29695/g.41030  ORF Transcript_29695/g.41030 Transcript_29695/m.41030 type:complete len:1213 (-) Transcript_29695:137-3775(-)|eukprot:CAMPEP_0201488812 /NCGR_PEP_ID=MMETSP0151_2-20130828/19475_1 /ASSEMBLY_ACC=CAM_ASM_000257 /TAXON_ID=200890 /ORGANISM="Paramoeba atlantica, Strain 621/1 / CCAP 1560/9" /LENGTH=1212 /DNA_ID=CAMNT_0047874173 /DNA_START=80 /DNA_END=3718 /DNA_ORIENTATION=-
MESLFHKSLVDLVRGLRNNKGDEGSFVNDRIQEIKEELKNPNIAVKTIAIEKLTYLQMIGYDMNWAAFNVIEVMSCPKFSSKRVGYLAASQSFREDTSVILLTTNLFRKDMTGQGGGALATNANFSHFEAGLALNCLANICTKDLARDLAADVVALLNSSKPYVRKKSILCLYKIFLRFPKSLRPSFPRLRDKLEDADMSVVSSAVNVICELARKNPKNYLGLAPIFFKILTASNNNWMLIKIVKLFGSLTPLEKRLGRKLVEPLSNMINTTSATSLLYECIQTCIVGLSEHQGLIRLCITKLRAFVEDPDQNLKYLGLLALHKIMLNHPKAVMEHREMVIKCLDSEDISIRSRALDLLVGMVGKRDLMEIVQKLMERLETADTEYADKLVEKIIYICSRENYHNVTDFEWYLNVLMELTHVKSTSHGRLISSQMLDVTIRVKSMRSISVQNMVNLLRDPRILTDNPNDTTIQEVLYAAAYIVGEYADLVDDHYQVLEYLVQSRVLQFKAHIQAVFLLNAVKILAFVAGQVDGADGDEDDPDAEFDPEYLNDMVDLMKENMVPFTTSTDIEVQERACFNLTFVNSLENFQLEGKSGLGLSISALFDSPLNPVAARAQKKVPLPAGLDLDQKINDVPEEKEEDFSSDFWALKARAFGHEEPLPSAPAYPNPITGATTSGSSRQAANPFLLSGSNQKYDYEFEKDHNVEPLTASDLNMAEEASGGYRLGERLRGKRPRRRRKEKVDVASVEEMPEGAASDDDDKKAAPAEDDDDDLAAVDLTKELRADEVLPVQQHRVTPSEPQKKTDANGPDDGKGKRRRRPRGDRPSGRDGRDGRDGRRRHRRKPEGESGGDGLIQLDSAAPSQISPSAATELLDATFGAPHVPAPVAVAPAEVAPPAVVPAPEPEQEPRARRRGEKRRPPKERGGRSGRERPSSRSQQSQQSQHQSQQPQQQQPQQPQQPQQQPQQPQQQPQQQSQQQRQQLPVVQRPPSVAGKDENIQIIYDLQPVPNHPQGLMVLIGLRNCGSQPLSEFQFQLGSTMTAKVVEQAPVAPSFVLQSGASCSTKASFQILSTSFPLGSQCVLSYKLAQGGKVQCPFQLRFSASFFAQPIETNIDALSSLLASSDPKMSMSSIKVPSSFVGSDMTRFLSLLTSQTRLFCVMKMGDTAALYGRSRLNSSHLCVYVHWNRQCVEVHCSDNRFGEAIASEISQLQ